MEQQKPATERPPGGLSPTVDALLRLLGPIVGVTAFTIVLVTGHLQRNVIAVVLSIVLAGISTLRDPRGLKALCRKGSERSMRITQSGPWRGPAYVPQQEADLDTDSWALTCRNR